MMQLQTLFETVAAALPFWVEAALPLCCLPLSVAAHFSKKRGVYYFTSLALFGLGLFLAACRGWGAYPLAYLGFFAFFFSLFSPIALAPRRKRGNGVKKSRKERMYERYRPEIGEPPSPPKICCFEEEGTALAEESGFRLEHVQGLLTKLRSSSKLTAVDRLETDALCRTVESCRSRPLTADELRALNDCLAAVLKLTAKYKI